MRILRPYWRSRHRFWLGTRARAVQLPAGYPLSLSWAAQMMPITRVMPGDKHHCPAVCTTGRSFQTSYRCASGVWSACLCERAWLRSRRVWGCTWWDRPPKVVIRLRHSNLFPRTPAGPLPFFSRAELFLLSFFSFGIWLFLCRRPVFTTTPRSLRNDIHSTCHYEVLDTRCCCFLRRNGRDRCSSPPSDPDSVDLLRRRRDILCVNMRLIMPRG